MVNINSVRETVLAICNKNNYGYISPDDFNLYAKQAQLEVFSSYMERYNYYVNLENQHMSGSDLADLAEGARENVEVFITSETLTPNTQSGNVFTFNAPDNWYHINALVHEPQAGVYTEIAKISRYDHIRLSNSNLTAPTVQYPVYFMGAPSAANPNGTVAISPVDIDQDVIATYVRYPIDPEWGYVTLDNGEPMQNQGTSVNFEVSEDDEPILVQKILEKAGLSIREPEVYKTAQANDNQQR